MHVRIPSAGKIALAMLALVTLFGGWGEVFAAPGECRFIQSRKERNACYAREEAAKAAAKKSGPARVSDQIDQMKIENDRLGKRLQGICRGC